MENQEIFEMLSENECKAFYAWTKCEIPEVKETLKAAHIAARIALVEFAKATGFHN